MTAACFPFVEQVEFDPVRGNGSARPRRSSFVSRVSDETEKHER